MIFEIIKGQGYQKRIPLGNGLYAQPVAFRGRQAALFFFRRTPRGDIVVEMPENCSISWNWW